MNWSVKWESYDNLLLVCLSEYNLFWGFTVQLNNYFNTNKNWLGILYRERKTIRGLSYDTMIHTCTFSSSASSNTRARWYRYYIATDRFYVIGWHPVRNGGWGWVAHHKPISVDEPYVLSPGAECTRHSYSYLYRRRCIIFCLSSQSIIEHRSRRRRRGLDHSRPFRPHRYYCIYYICVRGIELGTDADR